MIIFALIFTIFVITIARLGKSDSSLKRIIDTFNGVEHFLEKIDCLNTNGFCFVDTDCVDICSNQVSFWCLHGVCKSKITESGVTNTCDPKRGLIGYLVGDVAFGRYKYVCKSIDPGIALTNGDNLMCKDGTIDINYLNHVPMKDECKCNGSMVPVTIPATSEKREHVQCVDRNDTWVYSQ